VGYFALLFLFLVSMLPIVSAQALTESALYSFKGGADGENPRARLFRDGTGNLYGTTPFGGSTASSGIVFKISTTGAETILHKFTGGADGGSPQAGLIRDAAGNFYGTSYSGGTGSLGGNGVVFKLTGRTETVIHSFTGPDGSHPAAGLVRDSGGNLYGTTFYGGTAACSCGTVFKIDSTGTETVLYSFKGGADGKFPQGGLLLDSLGNLYGTASEGGVVNCDNGSDGCGVVFKVDTSGNETVLYAFAGGASGGAPLGGLVRDSAGNFYGTAFFAGNLSRNCALNHGCGVVYKVDATGQEHVLHTFTNGSDGANPVGDLVRDATTGNLYGTTKLGGKGYGVVFKVSSTGTETTLYSFSGGADGAGPVAGLLRDSSGNLYGTTAFGGASLRGAVFKLTP
jgi:uncharacterized repeat protein (TIGR03803 family)